MAQKNFETHRDGAEGKEKPKSVFELPRAPWDKKTDVKEYARRERAHFVGKLLLAVSLRGKKDEPKEQHDRRKDLEKALKEKEVALEGVYGKKRALSEARAGLAMRFEDFRQSEKTMGHVLEPFTGEKRETLYGALDHELNPTRKEEKPLPPEQQELFGRALEEFDERTLPEQRQAMHLAAYMHLKQERVFEAEDQLNGTREQALDREMNVAVSERDLTELLQTQPELASAMTRIATSGEMSDDQKVRAIDAALTGFAHPEGQRTIDGFSTALEQYSVDAPGLQERIADGERALRTERETLARAQELADPERILAQIPEDADSARGQKTLERTDVASEDQ